MSSEINEIELSGNSVYFFNLEFLNNVTITIPILTSFKPYDEIKIVSIKDGEWLEYEV